MEEEIKIGALDDALRILKGNISGGMWLVLFITSLSAILLSIYAHYRAKGKNNPLTPGKFSWSYALFNNILRILAGLVVMFWIFRLAFVLVNPAWLASEDMYLLFALGVGFFMSYGVDKGIQWLQKRTNILQPPNPYSDVKKEIIQQIQKNENN